MGNDEQGRRILYDDRKSIKVVEYDPANSEHALIVGDFEYLIPRGVLSELTRSSGSLGREEILNRLNAVTGDILERIVNSGIDPNDVIVALHRARIAELDMEVNKYLDDLVKARNK